MNTSRLFEWHDGPLVLAMKEDSFFLLDEISLADDSVLERLNRYMWKRLALCVIFSLAGFYSWSVLMDAK